MTYQGEISNGELFDLRQYFTEFKQAEGNFWLEAGPQRKQLFEAAQQRAAKEQAKADQTRAEAVGVDVLLAAVADVVAPNASELDDSRELDEGDIPIKGKWGGVLQKQNGWSVLLGRDTFRGRPAILSTLRPRVLRHCGCTDLPLQAGLQMWEAVPRSRAISGHQSWR